MGDKRAYTITNSEISALFWGIQLILSVVIIVNLLNMYGQVAATNPGLAMTFMFMLSLLFVGLFFSFMSMALPNYMISKYNYNILIDKLTNTDFVGWIRLTRSRSLRFYTVPRGALGQTKGMANGQKADAIDDGRYTITLPNGNQAIITDDFLSTNVNLKDVIGWQLIQKHHGLFGFDVWDKAAETNNLLTSMKEDSDEKE